MQKLSVALLTIPALGWLTDLAPTSAPWNPARQSSQDHGSVQEPAPEPKPAPERKPGSDELSGLIAKLGSPDDAVRTRALDELAKRGEASRAALEAAAKESQDPEVRWNARKLLRRLEDAKTTPPQTSRLERHEAESDRPPIGGLDELDGLGGLRRIDAQDPGSSTARGTSKSVQVGPDGRVKVTVTEEVDGRRETKTYEADSMDELRRQHPGVLDEIRIGTGRDLPGFGGLQEHFDRLRQELGQGGLGRRGFEGLEGMEGFEELRRALEQDLPGLLEKRNLRLDEQLRPLRDALKDLDGSLRERRNDPGLREETDLQELPSPPSEIAPHERLGVRVEPLHPEVVSFLELPEATGLRVAEVLDGTLAQSLGLREKDVLVSIQGEPVRTPESIRAALAKTPLDAKVRLEVLRYSSGRVTVEGTRPQSVRDGADGSASGKPGQVLPPRTGEPKKLERPGGGGK